MRGVEFERVREGEREVSWEGRAQEVISFWRKLINFICRNFVAHQDKYLWMDNQTSLNWRVLIQYNKAKYFN